MKKKNDVLKEEGMHTGANANKFAFASILRNDQTSQEEKLWQFLRTKPKGLKFRRQPRLNFTFLDFIVIMRSWSLNEMASNTGQIYPMIMIGQRFLRNMD